MKRIEKIAEMVQEGVVPADIGTDHAFLPILLVRLGKCSKVYACDIHERPLQSARTNIAKENMTKSIIPVLSDGFDQVPDDVDCAVLAGMGYYTAVHILENAMDRLADMKQIIVEVNRNVTEMRKWISDHHYTIMNEEIVYENGFDYVIISFNTEFHEAYTEEEWMVGPVLRLRKDDAFVQYCERNIKKAEMILAKIPDHSSREYVKRAEERKVWKNSIQQ